MTPLVLFDPLCTRPGSVFCRSPDVLSALHPAYCAGLPGLYRGRARERGGDTRRAQADSVERARVCGRFLNRIYSARHLCRVSSGALSARGAICSAASEVSFSFSSASRCSGSCAYRRSHRTHRCAFRTLWRWGDGRVRSLSACCSPLVGARASGRYSGRFYSTPQPRRRGFRVRFCSPSFRLVWDCRLFSPHFFYKRRQWCSDISRCLSKFYL